LRDFLKKYQANPTFWSTVAKRMLKFNTQVPAENPFAWLGASEKWAGVADELLLTVNISSPDCPTPDREDTCSRQNRGAIGLAHRVLE
jgi:hypothetical protein